MGFPTANIRLNDDRKLLPAAGVYAVKVQRLKDKNIVVCSILAYAPQSVVPA